jgi:hypothetical protein
MRAMRWLLVAAAVSTPVALSAQGFEGVVKQQVKQVMPQGVETLAGADAANPEKALDAVSAKLATADASLVTSLDVTVRIKGSKMRVDGAGSANGAPDAYSVLDAGTSTVYTVLPSQQRIMVISGDDFATIRKALEAQGMPAPSTTPPTRTDLGQKTINGVKATGYKLVSPDGVAVVWVDPARKDVLAGFAALQQKAAIGGSSVDAAARELGFPVRSQALVKAPPMMGEGWRYTESLVTSVQQQPVADDVFAMPAGYTQVRLAEMMGGGQ